IPHMTPFPGPRSVLGMDNAKIHHGEAITALAERFGIRIEYLPPYLPDFNPIEQAFSKIKVFLRRNEALLSHGDGILFEMEVAMGVITAQDACGYFRDCGYF
ncbi:hypothetical protein FISHEDRAFT_49556, partial [Fistulina hepatica ATCC 64428]